MPRLTDPDRLAAYRDALSNWAVTGYIYFSFPELAGKLMRELGVKERDIKRLMYEYVASGGEIDEVRENRDGWKEEHEFHHDMRFTIQDIPLYIETRLKYRLPVVPDESRIEVVNIHEQ